jgi:hypothetical protein
MLPHTHPSSFFHKHKKDKKKKEKKLIWNVLKIYCWKNNKKVFGRRALQIIAPCIIGRREKKGT